MNWNPFKPKETIDREQVVKDMIAEARRYPREVFVSCILCERSRESTVGSEFEHDAIRDKPHVCWGCADRLKSIETLVKRWIREVLKEGREP
jgi:hypothetical protein